MARGTAAQAARWEVIERMQKVSDFWGPTIVLLDDVRTTGATLTAGSALLFWLAPETTTEFVALGATWRTEL